MNEKGIIASLKKLGDKLFETRDGLITACSDHRAFLDHELHIHA